MVGHGAGRDKICAGAALQRLCQLGVQGQPLAERNHLVRHVARQHLPHQHTPETLTVARAVTTPPAR